MKSWLLICLMLGAATFIGGALAGNPSGATPHQYKVYCSSISGVWVSNLQTCNGVPLSVWARG